MCYAALSSFDPQQFFPHPLPDFRSQHEAFLSLQQSSLQHEAAVLSFMQDFASLPPQQDEPSLPAQQEAMSFASPLPWRMHAACPSFAPAAIIPQQAHVAFSVEVLSVGAEGVA